MLIVAIGLDMLVGRRSAWHNTELRPSRKRRLQPLGVFSTYTALAGFCALTSALGNADDHVEPTPMNSRNPQAVERVRDGKEKVANAAWWGFDEKDATAAIQGAINSGAKTVIVPYVGRDWVVRPIKLKSHQRIFFEPGVVVTAKKGEFRGEHDCLFEGLEVENITLRGYGATFRMHKKDYRTGLYTKAEWRHTLSLRAASHVRVIGLRMENSGGDGIYIGSTWDKRRIPCRDIVIRDCVCDNNYRQGISVVSAEDLVIENCALRGTRGTSPQAGIDLEPSHPRDVLSNVRVVRCVAVGNAGTGLMVNLSRLNSKSRDVGIRFEECLVKGSRQPGMRVLLRNQEGPGGSIEFENCVCEDVEYSGALCIWNTSSRLHLRFINCKWHNVARRLTEAPLHLSLRQSVLPSLAGGIEFINCYVYDDKKRPALAIKDSTQGNGKYRVTGKISVINRHGNMDDGTPKRCVGLDVTYRKRQD